MIENKFNFPKAITGINKEGKINRDEMAMPLPEKDIGIPMEVYFAIKADLDNLPESNEPLKFKKGEYLELAINSNDRVRYKIREAMKGHYFIEKIDITTGATRGEFFSSKEEKTSQNPHLIVCNSKELEGWFKKIN